MPETPVHAVEGADRIRTGGGVRTGQPPLPNICDEACLYCERPLALTVKHEHDHMPIPGRYGGQDTFCVCRECHSLKDRQNPILDWDVTLAFTAWQEMWAALSPAARIMYAHLMGVACDVMERRDLLQAAERDQEPPA